MFNIKNIVSKITERGRESQPNSPGRASVDEDMLNRQAAEGFLCPKCMKAFPSAEQLQAHYHMAHDSVDDEMASDALTAGSAAGGFLGMHQEVGERYKLQRQNGNSVSQERLSAEIHGITNVAELQKSLMDALESKAELQFEKESLEQRTDQLARVNAAMKSVSDEESLNHATVKQRLMIVEAQLAHRESIDDAAVLRQELVQVQRVMDELTRERERERDQLQSELQQLKSENAEEKKIEIDKRIQDLLDLTAKQESQLREIESTYQSQFANTASLEKALLDEEKEKKAVALDLTQAQSEVSFLRTRCEELVAAIEAKDLMAEDLTNQLSNALQSVNKLESVIVAKDEKCDKLSQDLSKLSSLKAGEGASAAIIEQVNQENMLLQTELKEAKQKTIQENEQLSTLLNQNKQLVQQLAVAEESYKAMETQQKLQLCVLQETETKLNAAQTEKSISDEAQAKLKADNDNLESINFELLKKVDQYSERLNMQEIEAKQKILNQEDLQFQVEAAIEMSAMKDSIISDLQIANQAQLQEFLDLEHEFHHAKSDIKANGEKINLMESEMKTMEINRASLETSNFELRKLLVERDTERKSSQQLLNKTTEDLKNLTLGNDSLARDLEEKVKLLEAVQIELENEQTRCQESITQVKEVYHRSEEKKGTEITKLQSNLDEIAGEKLALEALLLTSQLEQKSLLEKYYVSCGENEAQRRTIDDLHRRSEDSQSALHELGRENQILRLDLEKLLERKWTEDSDVASCQLCHKEFSLIVRKHHCRNCGQIFCNECSAKNAPVANNKKPVRVCDGCYSELVTPM